MKIQKNKLKKRLTILTLTFFFTTFALVLFWYFILKKSEQSSTNGQQINLAYPTQKQKSLGGEIKKQTVEKGPSTTSQTDNISVTITSTTQNDNTLQIRSLVTPFVTDGTCTLELTHENQTISKTSTLQALANSASCRGFDISNSDLMKGPWGVVLTVSSEKGIGKDTKNIVVK